MAKKTRLSAMEALEAVEAKENAERGRLNAELGTE